MTSKFAVALIATTMFVAPALAADAVNSTAPATNSAAPTTTAQPAASNPASVPALKTGSTATAAPGKPAVDMSNKSKKLAVVHRHVHRTMMAHNGKNHVKTVSVTRSVKFVKSAPQAWPFGPFTWTMPGKTASGIKVAHHHAHHTMLAHGGKPSIAVKTAHTAKPTKTEVKTVGTAPTNAPATTASTAGKTDGNKGDVKVIRADKDLKNGSKAGKDSKTTTAGQSAQGSSAPAGKSNKDSGKVN